MWTPTGFTYSKYKLKILVSEHNVLYKMPHGTREGSGCVYALWCMVLIYSAYRETKYFYLSIRTYWNSNIKMKYTHFTLLTNSALNTDHCKNYMNSKQMKRLSKYRVVHIKTIFIYIHTHTHTNIYIYIYMYIYIYTCTYVYIYIYLLFIIRVKEDIKLWNLHYVLFTRSLLPSLSLISN